LRELQTGEPQVLAVIPARHASVRFPGKPLVHIQGKPMIQHVWERTRQVAEIDRVIVATDDARIAEAVAQFGGEVRMTAEAHVSGTDRVWEVASSLPDFEFILNVQGDEPFIDPASLSAAVKAIKARPEADIVTLVVPLKTDGSAETLETLQADQQNPNLVKAVLAQDGRVLYFSRAPSPFFRDGLYEDPATPVYRHLGLYAFHRQALERFTQLPPSPLERAERLEQLRAMENGMTICAVTVKEAPIGVDTPEDLARLEAGLA
jgi:3-deoxy-manno-octulosonate cytidylyltransferase (CMP-KDO synthetase)